MIEALEKKEPNGRKLGHLECVCVPFEETMENSVFFLPLLPVGDSPTLSHAPIMMHGVNTGPNSGA